MTNTNTSGTGIRDDAASIAEETREAGRQVTEVAKEETKGVASETATQARRLASQAREELRQQAAKQQTRAAEGLHTVGNEFSSMADRSDDHGVATDLVREAGRRVDRAAQWLDQRDPAALIEEVKQFARRRPGVFLAIAAGAGVVAGRLTRALMASAEQGGQDASTQSRNVTAGNVPRAPRAGVVDETVVVGVGTPTRTAGGTWSEGEAGYTETPSVEEAGSPTVRRGGNR